MTINSGMRAQEAQQHWQHGFAEGWLTRDKELREQAAELVIQHPRTWWERLIGKRR